MSHERDTGCTPDTLGLRERAILELCADRVSEREIAVRLGLRQREVSAIRAQAARKISVRISSAHPFHISEVVLARPLDAAEL